MYYLANQMQNKYDQNLDLDFTHLTTIWRILGRINPEVNIFKDITNYLSIDSNKEWNIFILENCSNH